MAQAEQKQLFLKQLVDELIKDQPRRQVVKQLSEKLGMAYSGDPVTQMNTVLQSMNSLYLRPQRRKDLES